MQKRFSRYCACDDDKVSLRIIHCFVFLSFYRQVDFDQNKRLISNIYIIDANVEKHKYLTIVMQNA